MRMWTRFDVLFAVLFTSSSRMTTLTYDSARTSMLDNGHCCPRGLKVGAGADMQAASHRLNVQLRPSVAQFVR